MTIKELIGRLQRYPDDMLVFTNHDGRLEVPYVRLCSSINRHGDYEELLLDDPNKEMVVSIDVAF